MRGTDLKILVFSDSHGNSRLMRDIYREGDYNAVIFLGDVLRDAEELARITGAVPVYKVKGNCDYFEYNAYEEQMLDFRGIKVFIAHGHTYGVKGGIARFEATARERGADIAMYGHTHVQYCAEKDGMHILNPGSLAAGRYATVTIEQNKITVELKKDE